MAPARADETADRRVAIADAALAVLAEEGARGLTHRAVDRHLGLPAGSTSYYFRTRAALLEAAEARLFSLDMADLARSTPDVDGVVSVVNRWLAPRNRVRLVARFELFLADARTPGRGPIAESRRQFADGLAVLMSELGAPDPRAATTVLLAAVEGLLVDGLTSSPVGAAARRTVIEGAMAQALAG